MSIRVVLGGFAGMVRSMKTMPMRYVRVMCGLLMVPLLMVMSGFPVVGSRMLVVFSSFSVVIGGVVVHHDPLSWRNAQPGGIAGTARYSKGL